MTMIIDYVNKVGDDHNSDNSGDDDGDDDVSGVGVEGDSWKLIRRLDYYLGPTTWSTTISRADVWSAIFYLT